MNELLKLRNDINKQLDFRFKPLIYNPTTFTLITGTDAVLDEVWSYQVVNKVKNHYYAATAPADIQNGMIWIDSDDGIPYRRHGGANAALLLNVVEDTTPQLGGDLDLNSKNIDFPSTANISDVKDEDNMASNSATMLATQQSIKAYVDGKTRDKIEEGNSSVEVIDAGTGYIETKADASQVRKDQVVGNVQPLQPCFWAYPSADIDDQTGDNTLYTPCAFNSELWDLGGNYNAGTYTFTAPVTGKYFFVFSLLVHEVAAQHTGGFMHLYTSNRNYDLQFNPGAIVANGYVNLTLSVIADMDATDTATIGLLISGHTKTIDIDQLYGAVVGTYWAGYLLC